MTDTVTIAIDIFAIVIDISLSIHYHFKLVKVGCLFLRQAPADHGRHACAFTFFNDQTFSLVGNLINKLSFNFYSFSKSNNS